MQRFPSPLVRSWIAAVVACNLIFAGNAFADGWPEPVEKALADAGVNRGELEKLLNHYRTGKDKEKFEAACFLIRNMPGHAYVMTGLVDVKGNHVAFDALNYKRLHEGEQAIKELEKKHGKLRFAPHETVRDLESVSADYLIENIDLAFAAWREKPWAKKMTFETFCEYILPYRANREPVERWRAACAIDTKLILAEMKDPANPQEAAGLVQKHTKHHIGFHDLYYLHPTDQGFKELCASRTGRCGDMANMQVYVYRANAIAVAGDYTPYWANRDNNHGWDVVLDKDGRGSAGLFNRAAKVYRKMFSHNPDNLFFHAKKDETLPPWLAIRGYRDVTEQYMKTTPVQVALEFAPPKPARFAFICVFNGGEWRPIHWSWIKDGGADFGGMGKGIAYLPAYFLDNQVVAAAPPFILDDAGNIAPLPGDSKKIEAIKLTGLTPQIKDDDLKKELPAKDLQQGRKYELFVWDRGWKSLGHVAAGFKDAAALQKLPANGLYWIASPDDRSTARIFTIENGKQRFW